MSQVSKRKLKKKDFEKIYNKLIEVFSKNKSKNDFKNIFKEFFYITEKIMFAKRLAILIMTEEKIPDRKIAKLLSVSTSTIGKIIDKKNRGDYSYLISLISKNRSEIWDFLGVLLFATFNPPSRVGMARYRWFEDAEKKYKAFSSSPKIL